MKTIPEQSKDTNELLQQMEQFFFQRAQNNKLIFEKDKEKIHEEFSYLCRKSSKENIDVYAKSFQLILDMDYEDGHFPIVATNHDNLEALKYFYTNHHDIYNKYYTSLINAASFNQSVNCLEFLTTHTETEAADINLSGNQDFHVDEF